MPELPDLEAIKEFLNHKILGLTIEKVEVLQPLVLRFPLREFKKRVEGKKFSRIERRGKYLLFLLDSGDRMVFHLMLSGRLQFCLPKESLKTRTCLRLTLSQGKELRYFDSKLLGKIYLVNNDDFSSLPQFSLLGPEAIDKELTIDIFRKRIKTHPGGIKNILTNQAFLAGIGSAYADEILFQAKLLPFRKRSSLSKIEIERLYNCMRIVLSQAIEILNSRMGSEIHLEIRDFFKIHGRGGESCPSCGTRISEITANQQITSFCRNCQK